MSDKKGKKMDIDSKTIAAILAALLAISESLGLTDKIKANSIVQLVGGFFSSLFKK